MTKRAAVTIFTLLLFAGVAAANPIAVGDALALVKRLSGTWRGTTERSAPIEIDYQIAAKGSTVIETQSPGEPDEMLTVYSIDGDNLVLTHYCPMGPVGNQPHLVLDRATSSPNDLHFTFVSLTNLDAHKDVHLHSGTLKLIDDQHLERTWDVYKDGHKVATQIFRLTRDAAAR
jgi:hypothetical protein